MKKIVSSAFLALFFTGISIAAYSQDQDQVYTPVTPKWISEKGFWQIETNKNTPENSIIYFFNNDGTLVYKERIEGQVINIKKRKVLMTLKKVLEESVVAYEERHFYDENARRVASLFRKQ